MTILSPSHKTRLFVVCCACALLLGYGPCAGPPSATSERISDESFARIITETSESGGYFWSNNYISNETSYLHVIDRLVDATEPGDTYIGVGPNQNFTYIAHTRPSLAFILDIRRDNLIEHLLFKALMLRAETRGDYLASLLGRDIPASARAADAPIELILDELERAEPDAAFFAANLDAALSWFATQPLEVTEDDTRDFERIYREFYRQGVHIKYDAWRSFFFPSLKELILEEDLEGRRRNWLVTEAHYERVRQMHRANRIIPLVGNFAGDKALRRLGSLLRARSQVVGTFYVSNVEFYLFRQGEWPRFIDNVRSLPINENSVFIRAYANLHRPHPDMIEDHITVSLVQGVERVLENERAGRYQSLWDVVTLP